MDGCRPGSCGQPPNRVSQGIELRELAHAPSAAVTVSAFRPLVAVPTQRSCQDIVRALGHTLPFADVVNVGWRGGTAARARERGELGHMALAGCGSHAAHLPRNPYIGSGSGTIT